MIEPVEKISDTHFATKPREEWTLDEEIAHLTQFGNVSKEAARELIEAREKIKSKIKKPVSPWNL